jgi:O-antigen/teichoic acid export membrane protein
LRFLELAAFVLLVPFSPVALATGISVLFCITVLRAALPVTGCLEVIAASLLLWLWACWRSEKRASQMLAELLLQSALFLSLFIAACLGGFIMKKPHSVSSGHVIALIGAVALFCYLCVCARRRAKRMK